PMSASSAASNARHAPWPAAVTNRNAWSISTTVCRTLPPPKCLPVPMAKLWNADATAERCSASPSSRLAERPINKPSEESTTARSAPTTRLIRSSNNQSSSLFTTRILLFPCLSGSLLECGQSVPGRLRRGLLHCWVGLSGIVGGPFRSQLRRDVFLPSPLRQRRSIRREALLCFGIVSPTVAEHARFVLPLRGFRITSRRLLRRLRRLLRCRLLWCRLLRRWWLRPGSRGLVTTIAGRIRCPRRV